MFVTVALFLLAFQSPSPSPRAAVDQEPSASREPGKSQPEPTKGLRKSVRARLVAIDTEQMTVRFTDEDGQQKTWPADPKLVAALPVRAAELAKAFSPGDPIYVVYHEDEGHPLVAELAKRTAEDDELDKRRQQEGKQ